MISEQLYKLIEKEGKRKDFKIREAYGERDKEGNFSFIIRLIPTNKRLSKDIQDRIKHDPQMHNPMDTRRAEA